MKQRVRLGLSVSMVIMLALVMIVANVAAFAGIVPDVWELDPSLGWVNGNAGGYTEGDAVPVRLAITDTEGTTETIYVCLDMTVSSNGAYGFSDIEPWDTTTTPTIQPPNPANLSSVEGPGFQIENGTINSVAFNGLGDGTNCLSDYMEWELSISLPTDNVGSDNETAYLVYGARLAKPGDTTATGDTVPAGKGASAVNGTFQIQIENGGRETINFNPPDPAPGTIVIVKDDNRDSDTVFSFIENIEENGFSLQDPSDNTKTFNDVPAGEYSVIENVPANWALGSIVCVDSLTENSSGDTQNAEATINLESGETVTCTFTNIRDTGTIEIIKDADPSDGTNFDFTGAMGNFDLVDGESFSVTGPTGTYQVTELVPAGWTLYGIACEDPDQGSSVDVGQATATVDLDKDETVTCTFYNSLDTGTIRIVKDATPADDTPFDFSQDIDQSGNFTLTDPSDDTEEFTDVPVGQYTVTELGEAGWTLDSISCNDGNSSGNTQTGAATINLEKDETVTCTFFNSEDPPETGTIRIVKDATPEDDTPFDFSHNIARPGSFILTDPSDNTEEFLDVAPGQYSVEELAESGWFLSDIRCREDGTQNTTKDVANSTATINLEAGETVQCTFVNEQTGTIRIIKEATPEDDTEFDFTQNIARPAAFTLMDPSDNTEEFLNVTPGQYTVEELAEGGWSLTDIRCREDGTQNTTKDLQTSTATINLEAGETVQCTFVNEKDPPEPGTITIIKAADPEDDTEFGFTHNIARPGSFTLQDPSNDRIEFTEVAPGQYTVTELEVQGWTLTGVRCTDSNSTGDAETRTATINLEPGESLSCTFVNVEESDGGFCPTDTENVGYVLTDLLGVGQGSTSKGFRTRKLVIPSYQNVAELYGQLAAVDVGQMRFVRFRYPDKSYIQIKDPTSPAFTTFAVDWWGTLLDPAPYIKGQFYWRPNASKAPRAFVLWPTYNVAEQYANVFEVFDESSENHVYWNEDGAYPWIAEQTQTLALPTTQAAGAALVVKVAIVDNNADDRPVVLIVTAGGVTETWIATGPDAKDTLNLVELKLSNLPAGTSEVTITLLSPEPFDEQYNTGPDGGDSAAMIGATASYACVEENGETTAGRTLPSNGR